VKFYCWENACPLTYVSNLNPTLTDLRANTGLRGAKPAINWRWCRRQIQFCRKNSSCYFFPYVLVEFCLR